MQPCPRQIHEATMPLQRSHRSHWRSDGTCSYCGSLNNDTFMKLAEAGTELGPTDKNYKCYISFDEAKPNELMVVASTNSAQMPGWGEDWEAVTPELKKKYGLSDFTTFIRVEPRGPIRHGKFYFQHLTEEQKVKFVELLNAGKLTIGYPGHFYRLPFFCVRQPRQEVSK